MDLVSVNVGLPAPLGWRRGHPVQSGILKQRVDSETLELDELNLSGDRQADLRVHGGPDKAVYAYASEHLPPWSEELSLELGPGAFGENLSTAGSLEEDVVIGDVWQWGDALMQVCQPRSPCFKLAMHLGTGLVGPRMIATGRTGWYWRVLQPGTVPVAGPLAHVDRPAHGVTVRDAWWAVFSREATEEEVQRVLDVPELAGEWLRAAQERMLVL